MKQVVVLSKQNIELAKEEVIRLVNSDFEIYDNLLIIDNNKNRKIEKRLGLSHAVYEFLFSSISSDINKSVQEYNWEKIYKEDFCVRFHGNNMLEKELSILIYNSLKKPKVNLENPHTKIVFFEKEKKIIACRLIDEVDKSFSKRKAHLRPELHPTSLDPRLARACINLTGLTKGNILDPFCGSGGILIEAGLMGFSVIGYDTDQSQIKRTEKNLSHYGIKNYNLKNKSALRLSKNVDAIVTDPPYGKSSKGDNIFKTYERFLNISREYTTRLVIIFPDFIDYKSLIKRSPWKLKKKFSSYVHKSLTKIIIPLFAH